MTDVKVTKAMRLAEIKELLADNADIVAILRQRTCEHRI